VTSTGKRDQSRVEAPAPSPLPPLGTSLGQGLRAVGSSPLILVTAFVSLLATWAAFVALGVEPSARLLSLLMALSPAHVFSDVPVAAGAGDAVGALFGVIGLGVVRAATFGLLTLLIVDSVRTGRPDARGAIRRLPRVAASLFSLYVVEVAAVVVLLQLLVGFLGPFGIVAVVGALYFFLLAPVVVAAEAASTREGLRRSVQAARQPGTRHLGLVVGYFLLLYLGSSLGPFGPVSPATPTLPIWSFALAATVLHTVVLGALTFRWLAVRHQVPARTASSRQTRR
jgi:hypothetical protein